MAGSTAGATQVITVVAHSTSSTTATLQAWNLAPGGGWLPYGPAIYAHVGSAGLTAHPSEFVSATPLGSFTLSQAFGALSNPGTRLPYFQTTPADWWISMQGPLYNTHQHCWSNCAFDTQTDAYGNPVNGNINEHLMYETPYYNYAVVVDTNPSRTWPNGSAVFLHVTDGGPTAGCVAIPQSNLVTIMRWLTPSAHPRMLVGIG